MSGISDAPFREIAWRFGAGLVLSEMVASEALAGGHPEMRLKAERANLPFHAVQIAGRDPEWMAHAVRIAEAGGASLIDINMGCPAKRVTNGECGAALMRDPELACRIIEAVIEAATVPVTLKIRLGWDRASINAPELARRAESLGIRIITVHGRTRDQFYKGQADWGEIARVREKTGLPLVVNGDIATATDARIAMARSGADAVMIGRAACGAPWLPGAIAASRDDDWRPDNLGELIEAHYRAILAHYGVELGVRHARKHLAWYFDRWADPAGGIWRQVMLTAIDPQTVRAAIAEAFTACDSVRRRAA
jgi:nifR3 family TIM-barrel protein